jgi:hypothetical protein
MAVAVAAEAAVVVAPVSREVAAAQARAPAA